MGSFIRLRAAVAENFGTFGKALAVLLIGFCGAALWSAGGWAWGEYREWRVVHDFVAPIIIQQRQAQVRQQAPQAPPSPPPETTPDAKKK